MATDTDSWFPLFEFQDWFYQSFLVLPTPEENDALPGTVVTAKKWAKGDFLCGQAFKTADGYILDGTLSFRPGIELAVSAKGAVGIGSNPAPFEATGTGTEGPTKGAIYQLVGWVFPGQPIQHGGGRVLSVRGSVRAVRGPDAKPETELGGMPVGTVGAFVIVSRGPA
ncbi:MAG: hypothetical protein P0120_24230 [Nitrospira sp.]|nr:hypothetical protein [Nitrospira sp.]